MKSVIRDLLGLVSKTIAMFTSIVTMLFDWTKEVKAESDEALDRYRQERQLENEIALQEMRDRMAKRRKEAGLNET